MPPAATGYSRPRTRTSGVKDTLLDWIRKGKYPPGSQLPSVPDLVTRLGVSRTVVREALQSLVGMNFIEMRPGLGCYVRSVPPELIVNADVIAALIDVDTLAEVAQARLVIEGAVARVAAVEATNDDIEEMESVLARIERLARRNQPMHRVTPDLHVAIAKATHNQVLTSVISSFNELMIAAGELIEGSDHGHQYRASEYQSHRELLDILLQRDGPAAQAAMEAHVQKTVDALMRLRKVGRP